MICCYICLFQSSAVTYKVDVEQSRPAPRKRTLPKWMLQADLTIQSLPSPVVKAGICVCMCVFPRISEGDKVPLIAVCCES